MRSRVQCGDEYARTKHRLRELKYAKYTWMGALRLLFVLRQ